ASGRRVSFCALVRHVSPPPPRPTLFPYTTLFRSLIYTGANLALARHGARHRKRSGSQQPSEPDEPGSGTAIALGALLDGIPESIDRKSTRLNSSHVSISYAVFCLKKKNKIATSNR